MAASVSSAHEGDVLIVRRAGAGQGPTSAVAAPTAQSDCVAPAFVDRFRLDVFVHCLSALVRTPPIVPFVSLRLLSFQPMHVSPAPASGEGGVAVESSADGTTLSINSGKSCFFSAPPGSLVATSTSSLPLTVLFMEGHHDQSARVLGSSAVDLAAIARQVCGVVWMLLPSVSAMGVHCTTHWCRTVCSGIAPSYLLARLRLGLDGGPNRVLTPKPRVCVCVFDRCVDLATKPRAGTRRPWCLLPASSLVMSSCSAA